VTFWQALVMGALQGISELFPVSSLGHAVLLPAVLHWHFKESDPSFLPFLVLLHLGTATGLFILFWREWVAIIKGFFQAAFRGRIETPDERMSFLLVVGTVPAGIIGVLFQKPLQALFASPTAAAVFLVINGLLLIGVETLRRYQERRSHLTGREQQEEHFERAEQLTYLQALWVGACQVLAFLPGISRSGTTMAGSLLAGLKHQEAARFSFLLATPVIAAAGVLEVPDLFKRGVPFGEYLIAAVLAGVGAYCSARFLVRYFRSGRLEPYGVYCIVAGVLAFIIVR
jgi:undecaprenyl-diphosphatase